MVPFLAGARFERSECRSEGNPSCHDEPFSHLLHPLSSVLGCWGPFQLTPPHIALVSIAVALTAAVSIAVEFTVVATTVVFAREWRSASVLPPSVLLLQVLITAGQAITALPRLSVVHTATIIMPPTTAAYPRHSNCHTDIKKTGKAGHAVEDRRRAANRRLGHELPESVGPPGIATIYPSIMAAAGAETAARLRLQSHSVIIPSILLCR